MAVYKEIHGTKVKSVTSDPPAPANGEMWYNSTERKVKGFKQTLTGSWATGGTLNSSPGRFQLGGAGTQTAALAFGGATNWPGAPVTANAETYNGSSWSEVNNLNTARRNLTGLGLQTAALGFGGGPPAKDITESWNGSSWTEVADLNTAKDNNPGGTGTQTAGIAFGGESLPGAVTATCETWNGSGWTEVGDLNSARMTVAAAGTSTSALGFGGSPSPVGGYTESWNGSAWTEVADLNTGNREGPGGFGASNTSALCASAGTVNTEEWNGSAWTEVANVSTAVSNCGPTQSGTTSLGAIFGGFSPPGIIPRQTTEEWTGPTDTTVTFSTS
tara:strand:- start:84 stop:1076 length:993 start_codon:yes stop_codon:yes gene_type:complete